MLHYAGTGDNADAVALLVAHGLDVNGGNTMIRPIHMAASGNLRVLQVMVALGADLRVRTYVGSTALDVALPLPNAFFLVANGVRLSTVREASRSLITPELEALERGVLGCRAAIVALLGVKRRRGDALRHVDRWVVRELAWCMWAERTNKAWGLSNAAHAKVDSGAGSGKH